MIKSKCIEKLNGFKSKILIVDMQIYNPLEIVFLTASKDRLIRYIGKEEIPFEIEDNGKLRHLHILSNDEIGDVSWCRLWLDRAERIGENIFLVNEIDTMAFWIMYAYAFAEKRSWLKQNVIFYVQEKLQIKNDEALSEWLAHYIVDNHLRFCSRKDVKIYPSLQNTMNIKQKIVYLIYKLYRKILRRMCHALLRIRANLHKIFARRAYFKYIERQGLFTGDLVRLDECKGSTTSQFMLEKCSNQIYFIKGNEVSIFNGLANEINAQTRIQSMSRKKDMYLNMISADINRKWIKFPYVLWETLEEYIDNGKKLTESQKNLLGENLVEILSDLQTIKIVHNDLHPGNIMVKKNLDGEITGFILSDFGCASVDGKYPWNKQGFWGRYIAKDICGMYRYNENIVDDAASAYLVYLFAGGNSGDVYAQKIKNMIGSIYFVTDIRERV